MDQWPESTVEFQDFFEQSKIHMGLMLSHTNLNLDPPNDSLWKVKPFLQEPSSILQHSQEKSITFNNHIFEQQPDHILRSQSNHNKTKLFPQLHVDYLFVNLIQPQSSSTKDRHLQVQSQLQLQPHTVNKQRQLEQLIQWLLHNSDLPLGQLYQSMNSKFSKYAHKPFATSLADKFVSLRKTKQQLIKYCMRKSFKFILELPEQNNLPMHQKQQRYLFARSKNKYIKQISKQKSMNKQIIRQIFSQVGFTQDYTLFLQTFQKVMREDNNRKVKYLAKLLAKQKDVNVRNIQMMKRLPWTTSILNNVIKIAYNLLQFSQAN